MSRQVEEPIPTRTFVVPVTESGSYVFAVSDVEVVVASIRVGRSVLSYATPGADLGEGRIALDFFGTHFHAALVHPHSKVEIEIEYRGDEFPKLHMGGSDSTDKKWQDGMGDVVDSVIVRNKAGAQFNAKLVYGRSVCGLRDICPISA